MAGKIEAEKQRARTPLVPSPNPFDLEIKGNLLCL
jgi:hypothetical protein